MTQKSFFRHSLESCTLQLNNWKPFLSSTENSSCNISPEAAAAASSDSSSKQKYMGVNGLMELPGAKTESQTHRGPCTAKKQCLSDRGSHKDACDVLDMNKLSLLEDDNRKSQNKGFRREGTGFEKTSSFERVYRRSIPRISSAPMARKRRRRGSCSGSGRSSDKSRNRMYGSDAPTIGASATYATCSDFPIAGTDSSGELFFHGDANWGSEMIIPINEVKNPPTVVKRDGKDIGGEPVCSWQGIDVQSSESGYGSEPGYRGDGELGYDEDGGMDELDEEEEDDVQITFWGDLAVCDSASRSNDQSKFDMSEDDKDPILEDHMELVGKSALQEQKVHHRFRRRRQDWRMMELQGNRHSLVPQNN